MIEPNNTLSDQSLMQMSEDQLRSHIKLLEQQQVYLDIINQFSLSLIDINSHEGLIQYVTKEVVRKMGFVDCVIYLLDSKRQVLVQKAAIASSDLERQQQLQLQEIPLGKGICGHVAETGQPMLINDVTKEARYLLDLHEARSEICVPIVHNNTVLGVIDCEDPRSHYFTHQHLQILTTVASMLSSKMAQCTTIEQLESTIQQLNNAEKIQSALFRIASLTYKEGETYNFYAKLHKIIGTLMNTRNFFVGLYDQTSDLLTFPYTVDEAKLLDPNRSYQGERLKETASGYVLRTNRPLLTDTQGIQALIDAGHIKLVGLEPISWLGVPFEVNERIQGIIVVQSYQPHINYNNNDKDLLIYVSRQISHAINRKLSQQQLHHQALHDDLTALPNRNLLIDRISHAVTRLGRAKSNQCHALLYLDLDRFKTVNDTLGHQVGDQLLIHVCQRISKFIRSADTFARLGGDEFAILMEDLQHPQLAEQVAERISNAFNEPLTIDGNLIQTSSSIGITFVTSDSIRPYELLQQADSAMYRAKHLGRGRYQVFDESMRQQMIGTAMLEGDIRQAIKDQAFVLYYQPIFHIDSNQVKGFEALVRWPHPEKGMISPGQFITIAEDTGLIIDLDNLVLRQAAAQIQAWKQQYNDDFCVTVNVSSRQFSTLDFVDRLAALYREYQLPPGSLCIEITEGALIEHLETAKQVILKLRTLGINIYLDDFGTGYSSLGYLHQLPIQVLKIDKSFINNIIPGEGNNPLIETILALASSLSLEVVAEGIEEQMQQDVLTQLGCDYGQGFLRALPMSSDKAGDLIGQQLASA